MLATSLSATKPARERQCRRSVLSDLETAGLDPRIFAGGVAWLPVASLFYALARRPVPVAAVVPFLPGAVLPQRLVAVLGPFPTFVHAVAFSMMLSSIVGRDAARRRVTCAVWAAVEIAFELSQHPCIRAVILQRPYLTSSVPYLRGYWLPHIRRRRSHSRCRASVMVRGPDRR